MKSKIQQSEASKKSSLDFGSASSVAARIRRAFTPLSAQYRDVTLINRLNKYVMAVFSSIPQVYAGNKKLIQGNVMLLSGFQFNSTKRLDLLLLRPPNISLLNTKNLEIEFVADPLRGLVKAIEKATAAMLEIMVYNMDLNGNADEILSGSPLPVSIDGKFRGAKLEIDLQLTGERLVLIAINVHYVDGKGIIGSKRAKAGAIIYAKNLKNGVEVPFFEEEQEVIAVVQKDKGVDWITY